MKMEHVIRAPQAGRVAEISVGEGDQVNEGDQLIELVAEPWQSAVANSPAGERDDDQLHKPVFIVVLTTPSRTQLEKGEE